MGEVAAGGIRDWMQNRHLLILSILLILAGGLAALLTLPRIEDPRITTRNAIVLTPFPGASAELVEALVTHKLELRLQEIAEVKTLASTSRQGLSLIHVELQDRITRADNAQVLGKVRDRLAEAAPTLPPEAGAPVLDDERGAVAYSLILALRWNRGDGADLGVLGRLAESLGDRLRAIPGTEKVDYFGLPEEEILVDPDPHELAAAGLTPAGLAGRIAAADTRRAAGMVRNAGRELVLEVQGAFDSLARIRAMPLTEDHQGRLLQVGDIAHVTKGWRDPPREVVLHQGRRAVLVAVRTGDGLRLDHWADRARQVSATFGAELDGGLGLDTVFDQSVYTEARLGTLGGNLLAGAGIIFLVVLASMGWRAALVVGSALPLSAAASLFGLSVFGQQIHQMSIFGMIVAIGLLIDNAIVMTDRVLTRRRAGLAPQAATAATVLQLAAPLFAATATTVLGFMPVFLLPGNVGDFVGPIATAVVLALTASFLLSLTLVPALAGWISLPDRPGRRRWWRDGFDPGALAASYRGLLSWTVRKPRAAMALAAVPALLGFAAMGTLGMQFFPSADRDQLEIQVWLADGSGIQRTVDRVIAIESAIREESGITALTWVAGASSPPVYYNQLRDQDDFPVYARGMLQVADGPRARQLEAALQERLTDRFPDTRIVVRAFGQGPPITAPVAFRIIGPDLDTLRRLGETLRLLLHELPEVTHTRSSVTAGTPRLWFAADEDQARLTGLSLGAIAAQFQERLDGVPGGRLLEGLEELPVRVRPGGGRQASLAALGDLPLLPPGGGEAIPAAALGTPGLSPEMSEITRRNGQRSNEIHAFLRQGSLPIEVTRALQSHLANGALPLPPGYRLELAGDSAEQQQAVGALLTYVPVLVTLMIATLVLTFRSFTLAALIALVGLLSLGLGMLALWLGGYPLGFNPLIGSAGLVGVAINGSIVVLAAIRDNPRARGGEAAAIATETLGATRHILATSLTTVAGFLPLLLSGGAFWPPLAVVIAGGVGLGIGLSLVFTPAAYRLLAPRLHRVPADGARAPSA